MNEIKGAPFKGFLQALAGRNLKLKLEEKTMEEEFTYWEGSRFKVGEIVKLVGTTNGHTFTICNPTPSCRGYLVQANHNDDMHTFSDQVLELAYQSSKFKVGDIVVQTGTCEFYTVAKLLDDACVEMMPNEHGIARRFHESALELAPPIGDAYIPHIPKTTIEVDASNWGKSKVDYIAQLPRGAGKSVKLEEIRKSMESSIGCPGVSYFPNLEHTYVPNEDDLKYIKDDMELTKKMAERIYSKTTHRDITKELRKTYQKKNKDYGDSFANSLDKHGLIAAIVRMDDKMSRLTTLEKSDSMEVSESMRDTVMDLANYAIMTAMWMDDNDTDDERMVTQEEYDAEFKPNKDIGKSYRDLYPKAYRSIDVCKMYTPEEWEKLRADIKSGAEEFDSDLLGPGEAFRAGFGAGIIGASDRDIYADNLKLPGADFDGDTTNS